ncbi:MAG: N-acetylmuramoyl-L-alanine amidase [Armatimonadota bacterium]
MEVIRRCFVSLLALPVAMMANAQTICIDPGHPSEVGRGTAGKKISEMTAAWKVAKLLEQKLKKAEFKVVLTKAKEGQFVKNKDRAAVANKVQADIMVRLHCDANEGGGFAVYVPMKKGTSGGKTGPSQAIIDASTEKGKLFHAELSKHLAKHLKDNGLMGDVKTRVGAKQGALTGSIFSEVPVVLVEMCCLTNAKDESFIASQKGQEVMAEALFQATKAALAGTKKVARL